MISVSTKYHHFFPSPLGWVAVGLTTSGQVERLSIQPIGSGDTTLLYTGAAPRTPRILECLKSQLESYFRLQCRTFNIPLSLAGSNLELRVWNELLTLQFGQCLDLSVLALRVGMPANAPAVAKAIRNNPVAILIPSHRVLGWEGPDAPEPDWLHRLRALEDIVPGESTCMMYSTLPTTAVEVARSAALSPPAHFVSTEPRGSLVRSAR